MIVWLASSFSCRPWSPWSQSLLRGKAGRQRVVAGLLGAALRKGGKNVQPGCGGEAIPHKDQPTSGRLSWEDREHAGRDLWSREQCSETWPASRPIWAPLPLTTQSGRLLLKSSPETPPPGSTHIPNLPEYEKRWPQPSPRRIPPLRSAQDTTLTFSVAPQFPANSQLLNTMYMTFAVWSCSLLASPQTFLSHVLCSHCG